MYTGDQETLFVFSQQLTVGASPLATLLTTSLVVCASACLTDTTCCYIVRDFTTDSCTLYTVSNVTDVTLQPPKTQLYVNSARLASVSYRSTVTALMFVTTRAHA